MPENLVEQPFFRQGDAAIRASSSCAEEVFAGFEKVVRLNMQTAKTAVAEQQALADAALSAKSLSEVIDLQSQQLPAAVKKGFAYSRHVEDIAAETGTGLLLAMQEHIGRSLRTFWNALDISSGGASVPRRLENAALVVAGQPEPALAEPAPIVNSAGKVISSDDVQGKPH
ncbi:phasin family protein [Paraburkholderia sp. DGU8]|jgi:phasin family protein|uniref:phasin family protein n=1 Tax=Paraburkholderia sp. DGU8 TaxID=3161997 RepID=UPI00346737E0